MPIDSARDKHLPVGASHAFYGESPSADRTGRIGHRSVGKDTNIHDNHTQAILPYVTNPDSSAIYVSTQCPGPYTLPPRSLATLALMRYTRPSRRHVKRSSLGNANLVVSLDRRGNPLQWGKRLAFRDPLTRLPVQSPRSPTHRHTASARGVSFPAAGRAHQAASLGTCQVRTKLTDRKYGLTATGRSPRRRSR